MKKKWLVALVAALVVSIATHAVADDKTDDAIKKLRKRIQKLEVANAKDTIEFGGELRVEAHTITGEIGDYYDGMALQQVLVNTLFFHDLRTQDADPMNNLPMTPQGEFDYGQVLAELGNADNYGEYMMFLNGLQFGDIPDRLGAMLQDMVAGIAMQMGLDPANLTPAQTAEFTQLAMDSAMASMQAVDGVLKKGYDVDNDILYTTRLRLDMHAKVADDVSFSGRLAMYKPWGASTQVPMFDGQPSTIYMDANTPGVPGSEVLRVERAFFSWSKIGGYPMYLSLGRRPSTSGPPLHYRQDEKRGGTPLGTIIDFQFDGATFGYNVNENTVLRACYGLGYESQFGNATNLKAPADRLKDASFFGFNVDAWNTEEMLIQATVARAFNVTDGFTGYVIMPTNPVTGQAMPGPIMTRYNPSANLGDFDLASALITRRDGPLDWFISGSVSKSRPEDGVTTPFGGLFADPFETPEEQTGNMVYLGARMNFNDEQTKLGLEYNRGSQYWFNFAPAQDDIIAPKTGTRGQVWEGYVTHRLAKNFIVKLDYIHYDYDYSGSGWHLGAPKDLDQTQVLGFPTYDKAGKVSLSFMARF